jgi:DNA-binding response OmpR family regulator
MAQVLIAEHNQTVANYLTAMLKKAGNSVTVVDNYLDAWRSASQNAYDILMVDVVMPGIDGFVLAQKILQDNPELQVIFITGFSGVAMDTQATPAYAPAPITMRPFHLREAASRIRYLMGMGGLPNTQLSNNDGNVVYADFSAKAHHHQGTY